MFVQGGAGDAVTQLFIDDITASIHAVDGVVGAGGLAVDLFGAGDFEQVAVAVVVVLDAVVTVVVGGSGGIEDLEGAAKLVVGNFFIMITQCTACAQAGNGFTKTAQRVVFWRFDIATTAIADIV